jgi:hypothetical protein
LSYGKETILEAMVEGFGIFLGLEDGEHKRILG